MLHYGKRLLCAESPGQSVKIKPSDQPSDRQKASPMPGAGEPWSFGRRGYSTGRMAVSETATEKGKGVELCDGRGRRLPLRQFSQRFSEEPVFPSSFPRYFFLPKKLKRFSLSFSLPSLLRMVTPPPSPSLGDIGGIVMARVRGGAGERSSTLLAGMEEWIA